MDSKRLIEEAFPLVQASIDSVHEKNVRHGHISTLHIWPARRPLAACRAALIASLLPDPGNAEERARLLERIGGKVVHPKASKDKGAKKSIKMETQGGVLHWGRENALFAPLLRALIELSSAGSDERATLESISNHLVGRGTLVAVQGTLLAEGY